MIFESVNDFSVKILMSSIFFGTSVYRFYLYFCKKMTIKLISCTQWELNLDDDKSNLIRQVHVTISNKIGSLLMFFFYFRW